MKHGFTLAELLIALAILGVIATFTIPKVLQSQQDEKYKAVTKETIAALSGAFQAYQQENTLNSGTKSADLTPYLNYIQAATTGIIDTQYATAGQRTCGSLNKCIHLANGSAFWYNIGNTFGGTQNTRYIYFVLDPDSSTVDTAWNGSGKAIQVHLYYNGRVSSFGKCVTGDLTNQSGDQAWCPSPGADPPWFSWD